jgi:hypothetical protein
MSSLSSDDPSKEEEPDKDVDPVANSLMTKAHLHQRRKGHGNEHFFEMALYQGKHQNLLNDIKG